MIDRAEAEKHAERTFRRMPLDKCDRFELDPPSGGAGLTGDLPFLKGYSGNTCLFVAAVF